jgi:IclR family acetate operon transcriptional repressor
MQDDPTRPTKPARTGGVQSVERAMAILEVLGQDEEGCRLTEVAQRTGLSTSTVHRLLTTLERQKFVQFDQSDSMWHVGRTAFTVGSTFVRQRNFVAPALPYLRRLRDLTRETANLGVIDDGEVVVLSQVESREIMRAITRVGGRVPMVSSGMGKAILATYAPADVDAIVSSHGMRKVTATSLTRGEDLQRQLTSVRAAGYAVDDEEFVPGLRCVASVVYNQHGEALCAISVSGLAQRIGAERLPVLGKLLAETARELTLALGGRMPDQNEP